MATTGLPWGSCSCRLHHAVCSGGNFCSRALKSARLRHQLFGGVLPDTVHTLWNQVLHMKVMDSNYVQTCAGTCALFNNKTILAKLESCAYILPGH